MQLTVAGVELEAVSVAGLETCIVVPGWRTCFDIGRCPPVAARRGHRVLLTHGHVDHMGGVATHAALRDLWGMKPPEYVVGAEYAADLEVLLETWRRLSRGPLPAVVRPVAPGDILEVGEDKRIHVFRSLHRIPTLGYALERTRRKLREDLVGADPTEIARLRAAGEAVSEAVAEIEVVFCGDTTAAVIDREPLVRQARVLVLECTFLDGPLEKAQRSGHVHLDELVARAELLTNDAIVLTHFSARYSARRIRRLLDERVPAGLRERIVPLYAEPPWG